MRVEWVSNQFNRFDRDKAARQSTLTRKSRRSNFIIKGWKGKKIEREKLL